MFFPKKLLQLGFATIFDLSILRTQNIYLLHYYIIAFCKELLTPHVTVKLHVAIASSRIKK